MTRRLHCRVPDILSLLPDYILYIQEAVLSQQMLIVLSEDFVFTLQGLQLFFCILQLPSKSGNTEETDAQQQEQDCRQDCGHESQDGPLFVTPGRLLPRFSVFRFGSTAFSGDRGSLGKGIFRFCPRIFRGCSGSLFPHLFLSFRCHCFLRSGLCILVQFRPESAAVFHDRKVRAAVGAL